MYKITETTQGEPCVLFTHTATDVWYQHLTDVQNWSTECNIPIKFSRLDRTLIFQNHADLAMFMIRWSQ